MEKVDAQDYDYEWMDKSIALHRRYGIKIIDLSQLRQINEKDALKAAEYAYEDIKANWDIEPQYKKMLDNFNSTDIKEEDRPKAVGVIFELIDTCGKDCALQDLRSISRKWKFDESKVDKLMKAFFTTR